MSLCLHRIHSYPIRALCSNQVWPHVYFVCMYACTLHIHCTRVQHMYAAVYNYLLVAQRRMGPRHDAVF